jgi:hypothetical protein
MSLKALTIKVMRYMPVITNRIFRVRGFISLYSKFEIYMRLKKIETITKYAEIMSV